MPEPPKKRPQQARQKTPEAVTGGAEAGHPELGGVQEEDQSAVEPDEVAPPENTITYLAKTAATLGRDATHISRVIVNPYEVNENATPGLHIFFRGRVGDEGIKVVLDKLREAGITNGISLAVDPRVRPEIVKSLDPEMGANQYNGVRVQYIPEYGAAGGMTRRQIKQAFGDVSIALAKDANIAESRVLYYDTLVLKKAPIMTAVESLQRMLAIAERKHGPNAPGVKDLRQQLEEITRTKPSPTESEPIMHWSFGLRGKKKSESPDTKSSSEANPPEQHRRRSRPAQRGGNGVTR